jgi:hypothetical protein
MNIKDFAEKHRLKITRDACNDPVIKGRFGHIYEHDDNGALGVCLMFETTRKYNFAAKTLRGLGCTQRQDGNSEGCLTFDTGNAAQWLAVLKFAKIKRRRVLSEAQKASLDHARRKSPLFNLAASRAPEPPQNDKQGDG